MPTSTVAGHNETGGVVGVVGVGDGNRRLNGGRVTSTAVADLEGVATRPNPIAADAMTVVTGSADDALGMEALFRIDNRGDEQPPVTVKVVARCCLTDTRVRRRSVAFEDPRFGSL